MTMAGLEDVSFEAAVQRRQARRGGASGRTPYPNDLTLQIDNFTSGPSTPVFTPAQPQRVSVQPVVVVVEVSVRVVVVVVVSS